MKLHYITALAAGMALFTACDNKPKEDAKTPSKLMNRMDSVNYAFGVDIGNSLKVNDVQGINPELIQKGIADMLDSASAKALTPQEAQKIIGEFFREIAEKQKQKEMQKYEGNKAEGIAFLEQNKTKTGVVALPSGIQYEILKEGKGAKPAATDRVKVHYHGTLIDGTVFDSSVERGEPITLALNQVIPGWTETLQLMPIGSKWKVVIPSELGYGDKAAGELIPPFSTLVFEIELLEINPK